MLSVTGSCSLSICAQQLDETLKTTFSQVRHLAEAAQAIWERIEADGRQPTAKDLASLRPTINQKLLAPGAFSCGGGVVVKPSSLADREMYIEWWYLAAAGKTLPLNPSFDQHRTSYYDYTKMPWYIRPKSTGFGAVEGPYIDLYGTNMYVLTFTVPILAQGRFVGVAGLDLPLHSIERRLLQCLLHLKDETILISHDDRIIASNTANWMVGDLFSDLSSQKYLNGDRLELSESDAGWSLVTLPTQRVKHHPIEGVAKPLK